MRFINLKPEVWKWDDKRRCFAATVRASADGKHTTSAELACSASVGEYFLVYGVGVGFVGRGVIYAGTDAESAILGMEEGEELVRRKGGKLQVKEGQAPVEGHFDLDERGCIVPGQGRDDSLLLLTEITSRGRGEAGFVEGNTAQVVRFARIRNNMGAAKLMAVLFQPGDRLALDDGREYSWDGAVLKAPAMV